MELEDLHPKKFVQKHLFSKTDIADLRRPFDDTLAEINSAEVNPKPSPDGKSRFDPDAT